MSDQKYPEQGQATVEFAILLPFVALLLIVVLQMGVVARDSILLSSATREAARSLATENNKDLAASKAKKNLEGVELQVSRPTEVGSTLSVTGTKTSKINLLFITSFDFKLKQTIHMRVEK